MQWSKIYQLNTTNILPEHFITFLNVNLYFCDIILAQFLQQGLTLGFKRVSGVLCSSVFAGQGQEG